jgi:hypothetical protein
MRQKVGLALFLCAFAVGCRNLLGIDEDQPLLGDGTGGSVVGSGGSTSATSGGQTNQTVSGTTTGAETMTSAASGNSDWPSWPLTPDGAPTANYTVTSDSVTDKTTGLMWQRKWPDASRNFVGALKYCEDLILAGFDDWRLPTRIELLTLVTFEFDISAVNTEVFVGAGQSGYLWTSSPFRRNGATGARWTVGIATGSPEWDEETDFANVLCMRSP